jgi:hypothetical protein
VGRMMTPKAGFRPRPAAVDKVALPLCRGFHSRHCTLAAPMCGRLLGQGRRFSSKFPTKITAHVADISIEIGWAAALQAPRRFVNGLRGGASGPPRGIIWISYAVSARKG